jgi:hypothetical protein
MYTYTHAPRRDMHTLYILEEIFACPLRNTSKKIQIFYFIMEDENVVAAEAGGVTTEESIQLTEVPAKKSAFSSSKEATVFDLGSTPLSFTVEDRLDPAAVDLGKHKRCCVCCVEDSFPSRFWSRIKLDHVVADNRFGCFRLYFLN